MQVASAASQEEAIRQGLQLTERLGADRPPFVRGQVVPVQGARRILLFAGPFVDGAAGRRFCGAALPGAECVVRTLPADAPPRAGETARTTPGR